MNESFQYDLMNTEVAHELPPFLIMHRRKDEIHILIEELKNKQKN